MERGEEEGGSTIMPLGEMDAIFHGLGKVWSIFQHLPTPLFFVLKGGLFPFSFTTVLLHAEPPPPFHGGEGDRSLHNVLGVRCGSL